MEFNNGNERRKLNKKWERLRVQYQQAGMSEDAIQAMYDFDLGVLNSERSYVANTLAIVDDGDDNTGRKSSDFKQYEKAITVTDTYHETRTRFAWVGEIKDKRLQEGLEKLSDEELRLITLYFRDEYSTVELSKVYGIAQQNISKRILKITKFLKKFGFLGVGNMAAAIMKGMCLGKSFDNADVLGYNRTASKVEKLSEQYGLTTCYSVKELMENSDVVVLSVKPQVLPDVMPEVKELLREGQLVISIAAGKEISYLQENLGEDVHIVRVMPNVNAQALMSTSCFTCSANVTDEEKEVRKQAVRDAAYQAALVPKNNGYNNKRVYELVCRLEGSSNPACLSDLMSAKYLSESGVKGCVLNIQANLSMIKDEARTREMEEAMEDLGKGMM